jgi:CMP-N,N'-diacetyllegionaminic acid synthase
MSEKSAAIVALMIGRGGSSLKDKNILPVLGFPLLQWTAAAAIRSRHIGRYYVSSDCQKILDSASLMGYTGIVRPPALSGPSAQSCDAILHALEQIERDGPPQIIVVQHANVGTITEAIIDACIDELLKDPNLSAVVPCHEKPEYHPLRAKTITGDGLLTPYIPSDQFVSANRQDLPKALFFDHSIWALRVEAIRKMMHGQPPWPCMGNRIKPFITTGCLDVHSPEDIAETENWIRQNGVPFPQKA